MILGILLLIVSTGIYVYDEKRSDSEIHNDMQASLEKTFQDYLIYCQTNDTPNPKADSLMRASRLVYDAEGVLKTWTNVTFLPAMDRINRLSYFKDQYVWETNERAYYVIQQVKKDSTTVILIPLRISYRVQNQFLIPYFYLGTYHDLFYGKQATRNVLGIISIVGASDAPAPIVIEDLRGQRVIAYQQIPTEPIRQRDRLAVLMFLALGILALCMYLRIYALDNWPYRYLINTSLFFGVILLRIMLWLLDLPGNYLKMDLFSPELLAFHFLAPSLGEFTLNVVALVILVWIVYVHLFRMSTKLWHKWIQNHYVAWIAMLCTTALVLLMGLGYTRLFEMITSNSQVDLEFSNIFSADLFAFLILLNVGLLFLVVILGAFTLLKFNVLYGRRYGFTPAFWLIHLLGSLVFSISFYQGEWSMAITMTIAVTGCLVVLGRIPFKPILHHDIINYLMLLLLLSTVVTVHFSKSIEKDRTKKANRIALGIIGRQVINVVSSYESAKDRMTNDSLKIRDHYRDNSDPSELLSFLKESYFNPRMKEFDVRLFVFDKASGTRLDKPLPNEDGPQYTPITDISPKDIGDSVSKGLYRLRNPEDRFGNFFVGEFDLAVTGLEALTFFLEVRPSSRNQEGLYPSLTSDSRLYEEKKLINTFDNATYRNGILTTERGISPFAMKLENFQEINEPVWRIVDGYHELIQPVMDGTDTHVVVRYPVKGFLDHITSFSFIFYFFVLASILVIGLPVVGMRSLRSHQFTQHLPLRAKIRFGLLVISVLPMIFIMLLLSPFIYHRYENQAVVQLSEETARITRIIDPVYQYLRNDLFSKITLRKEFDLKIKSMEEYVISDVNVFDESGRPVKSTRTIIFDEGISSDLMNPKALAILSSMSRSDIVLTEKIGNKEYFSGYRSIIGKNETPIGYVNVPYLTKQEDLDAQVTDFLAYLANIYLVVFLLINLVAVIISSTITKPLKMIQMRIAATRLGKRNEPIIYGARDEIGAIVTAYNTMLKQLEDSEEKVMATQRELAWRHMAKQVAHEIKNPLTPMKLKIQLLAQIWENKPEKFAESFPTSIKTILAQVDTLTRIANSFSEFAKMPETNKSRVSVNEVLDENLDLFAQTEDIVWVIDVPENTFYTFADRDQLGRCFNNILKNAIQAIQSHNKRGMIEVSMRLQLDSAHIEIKDDGGGMSSEVQSRIFEPYFSTKTSGSGLGMSMVKKMIENSGGNISFMTKEGEGTIFFIELPRMEEETPSPVPAALTTDTQHVTSKS